MPRGLSEAARNPLASAAGRKRALVLLVAVPLLLAFALGAALGALAEANGWSALVLVVAGLAVAVAATIAGGLLLGAAQSVRRRHSTAWIPEKLAPLAIEASESEPRRIDLIHPAIDLKHFFGGFIAVFNLARRLAERGHAVRLIATERSHLPSDWQTRIAGYEGLGEVLDRIEVVFAADRAPLRFNPDDALIVTHWTVAHIAHRAAAELRGQGFLYLIQEYEPFIFPHGSAAALARASYDLPHRALFSTELLRGYFAAHRIGVFADGEEEGRRSSAVFDNAITPVGPASEEELRREGPPRLLFYARPEEHAQRNLFELGSMALDLAAASGYLDGWDLAGVGTVERGTPSLVLPRSGARVRMAPRTSQAEYAALLRSCDVGLALMYTPHPSLVPIEMAAAGMATVTNTFENKDTDSLMAISRNLIPAAPKVEAVAAAIARAVERCADLGGRAQGSEVEWPRTWEAAFDEETMGAIERLLAPGPGYRGGG